MKPIFWIIPATAMFAASGCVITDGPTESRAYANAGFDRIHASNGINVVVGQGPFAVTAEAPEGRLDSITIEQDGGDLKIGRKSEISWFGSMGHYQVTISAPSFAQITASGGADVDGGGLSGEALTLSASGGGDIDLADFRVTLLTASSSGGGDIKLSGTCATAKLSASGGGDFDGRRLDCADVTADASGGGDIDVRASARASGSASGGGDVRFIGAPAVFNKDESSGGDVTLEAP
jgi:hypothetical protein